MYRSYCFEYGNAWPSLEQGKQLWHILSDRVAKIKFYILCLEQGQGFVASAKPPSPNSCWAPLMCIFQVRDGSFHSNEIVQNNHLVLQLPGNLVQIPSGTLNTQIQPKTSSQGVPTGQPAHILPNTAIPPQAGLTTVTLNARPILPQQQQRKLNPGKVCFFRQIIQETTHQNKHDMTWHYCTFDWPRFLVRWDGLTASRCKCCLSHVHDA